MYSKALGYHSDDAVETFVMNLFKKPKDQKFRRGIKMQAPGRVFLLVTGIVYIVQGTLGIIAGMFLDNYQPNNIYVGGSGSLVDSIVDAQQRAELVMSIFAFILVIIAGYLFVVGVMGIVHRNNLEKAALLMTLGVIALIADVVSVVGVLILGTFTITTVLSLAIPICYIVGAYKNKAVA